MMRILIIEDNPTNMKLARFLLTSAGHEVFGAVSAEEGLAMAATDIPELILMDIQLPGMDGLSAVKIFKSDPLLAFIPIIALTAMAMKSDEKKIMDAGCDGYISKPLRYRDLFAAIEKTSNQKGETVGKSHG